LVSLLNTPKKLLKKKKTKAGVIFDPRWPSEGYLLINIVVLPEIIVFKSARE